MKKNNNDIKIVSEAEKPLVNFAKKEQIKVQGGILSEMSVFIPSIYYWEDVVDGKSYKMTMAFKIYGRNFGMSYPIEDDNAVKIDILRKKLFVVVKESLDVLVHHGEKVLDFSGNIHPGLVNDWEAIRYKYDEKWDKKVAAFNQLVRVAPITRTEAIDFGLLDMPKKILSFK